MTEQRMPVGPGWILISIAALLTLANFLLGYIKGVLDPQGLGSVSYALGTATAPILMALVVVGLFQAGKRFRNRRSRLKIYTWSLAVLLFLVLLQALQLLILLQVG